jgi:hypothetical protein
MPFGCLLVGPRGDMLVEEHNTVVTGEDITAHPQLKLARWGTAARPRDGTRNHNVHELPAVPDVHGRDRAIGSPSRRVRGCG